MKSADVFCPSCGTLNSIKNTNCKECKYIFSNIDYNNKNINSLEPNKDIFATEKYKSFNKFRFKKTFNTKSKTIINITDENENTYTIDRIKHLLFYAFFTSIVVFILSVQPITWPLEYHFIFSVVFLYFSIYIIGDLRYFEIFAPNGKNLGKIRKNKKFFNPKTFIQSDDWALFNDKRNKLFFSHFASFDQGFVQTKNESFTIHSLIDSKSNLYYRNIKGYRVTDKYDNDMIIIYNGRRRRLSNGRFSSSPKDFEIYANPDIDEVIVFYCAFIIIKKYLNFR